MKINYKNTALSLLDKMDAYQFRLMDDSGMTTMEEKTRLGLSIVRIWPNILPRFKNKIQYISKPFHDAYQKGCHKLADVLDNNDVDESGVLISGTDGKETNTIFYSIKTWGKGKDYDMDATVLLFTNRSDWDKPSLAVLSQRRPGMPVGGARFYASKSAQENNMEPISVIADILTLCLFMKYCELETKIVQGGKKENHIGVKYVNDTKNNIEILDSTWFTTLVKSEGFHVRGHFRMQPYGPGMSQKKLIWISDFDKTGYTRQAKILNH